MAFVDSLATKQRAQDLTDEQLRRLIRWQNEYRQALVSEGIVDRALLVFTDNIAVGTPTTTTLSLFGFLYAVAMYQLGLLLHADLLSRGAVTEGQLYIGPSLAHGAALVEAAELEQKAVCMPRIALSVALTERVGQTALAEVEGLDVMRARSLLVADSDGQTFVSYLATPMFRHPDSHPAFGDRTAAEVMDEHRALIERLLATEQAVVRSKLLWMAEYHNFIVEQTGVGERIVDATRGDDEGPAHQFIEVLGA